MENHDPRARVRLLMFDPDAYFLAYPAVPLHIRDEEPGDARRREARRRLFLAQAGMTAENVGSGAGRAAYSSRKRGAAHSRRLGRVGNYSSRKRG